MSNRGEKMRKCQLAASGKDVYTAQDEFRKTGRCG